MMATRSALLSFALVATALCVPVQSTLSDCGCCCCTGDCLWKAPVSKCPPCPCPAPNPGHPPAKCGLQSLKDTFVTNYKATVARLAAMPKGHVSYPSKTAKASFSADTDTTADKFQWGTSSGWTSGFFPGLLWQLANETKDADFAKAAATWTAGREVEKTETSGHDIGFMIFGSFGNGIQLGSSNDTYADVVVEAAHSLAKRYNAKVGMTRSWGKIDDDKSFEVIIDNLMNLELLWWAAAKSGNTTLAEIATSHAKRTGELWLREDGSTVHLCVFDPETGKLQKPCTGTPQGLSANSTWARGQGWGVYGFTLAHRYTKDPKFLEYAETCAAYYIKNAGDAQVPLWDFDAKAPENYPDTSSAAITASALLELSRATGESKYHDEAVKIIDTLARGTTYRSSPGESEAVLTNNQHDCESADCTVIETDYYLYEALRRLEGHFPPAL